MVFEKLHKFIGKNIKALVERGDQPYCLRLQRNRVFYVREDIMRRATNVCGLLAGRACNLLLASIPGGLLHNPTAAAVSLLSVPAGPLPSSASLLLITHPAACSLSQRR